MRIFILTDRYPYDAGTAATGWFTQHARSLSSFATVEVFCFLRVFPRIRHMLLRRGRHRPRLRPWKMSRKEGDATIHFLRSLVLPDTLSWSLTAALITLQHYPFLSRICREQRPDIILIHFTHPAAGIGLKLGRTFGIPVCIAANETIQVYRSEGKHRGVRWMRRRLARADAVITQCASHEDTIRRLIGHPRMHILPLGIREQNITSISPDLPPIACITVSRLDDRLKRIDVSLEGIAYARNVLHVDCTLRIVGDGLLRRGLERLAHDLGIAAYVTFSGWADWTRLPELYRRHHVFIFASEAESFGLVYLEAAEAALPMIVNSSAGVVTELRECSDGIVAISESSGKEVGEAIARIATDYALYRSAALEGRVRVLERFSWEAHARRYEEFLCRLTGKTIPHPPEADGV
ncbi:MAG: glycosyltransferase family 4 protein [Bacteroidetes bacterium]|nr:glycosyltransferase family 4 protein [Bacteroidota bacterium]